MSRAIVTPLLSPRITIIPLPTVRAFVIAGPNASYYVRGLLTEAGALLMTEASAWILAES